MEPWGGWRWGMTGHICVTVKEPVRRDGKRAKGPHSRNGYAVQLPIQECSTFALFVSINTVFFARRGTFLDRLLQHSAPRFPSMSYTPRKSGVKRRVTGSAVLPSSAPVM